MWNESFQGGKAERKFTQNSSYGTTRSTRFRRTKRGTEHLIPLHSIMSHVPNGTIWDPLRAPKYNDRSVSSSSGYVVPSQHPGHFHI
ncbi:hypothetical protein ACFX2F_010636 [Malus domestica]